MATVRSPLHNPPPPLSTCHDFQKIRRVVAKARGSPVYPMRTKAAICCKATQLREKPLRLPDAWLADGGPRPEQIESLLRCCHRVGASWQWQGIRAEVSPPRPAFSDPAVLPQGY